MTSQSTLRAADVCAVLILSATTSAHAQLGSLRRGAQRAAGTVQGTPAAQAAPATPAAPAASRVNSGDVVEMTAPVLDRFQHALEAERADLGQLAQRLSTIRTPEAYTQCQVAWYQSAGGQAAYEKFNAVASSGDAARINAAAEELKAGMDRECGPDPAERERIRQEAPAHAERAAVAAGEFTPRQFAVLKERAVPFCRTAAALSGDGDVSLPGTGRNIYWVYTAAEAAALRERCGTLMQALSQTA